MLQPIRWHRDIRPNSAMADSAWFGEHPKQSIVKAGAWATGANVASAALTLVGTVILSRLLEPADVGLFALAFSFYSIPSLIVGPGLTAAAVQAPHLTRHQSSNLFWINVAANAVMAVILVVMAPSLAGWFHQPSLQTLCPVFALVLILEGFATQYRALLTRAMRFDLVAKIGFVIGLVSLSVAMVLAALGFGVWALVVQVIVAAVADRIALAAVVPWTPSWFDRKAPVRQLIRFSGESSLVLGMHTLYSQSQSLLIARYAAVSDVGYYTRGQALFQKPFFQLMGPLYAILLPALAARQHKPDELGAAVYRANSVLYTSLCPLLAWMIVSGPDIATTLLGPHWLRVGETLRFFALGSLPAVLFSAIHKMNEATGRPAWGIRLRALFLPLLLGALFLVAPRGAVWMAGVSAAVEVISAPFFLLMLLKQSPVPSQYFLRPMCECVLAFAGTLAMLACIAPVTMHAFQLPPIRAAVMLIASYVLGLAWTAMFQFGRDGSREVGVILGHFYRWVRSSTSRLAGM